MPFDFPSRIDRLLLSPLAREVRRRNLTYLPPAKLRALERDLKRVRAAKVPGDFIEFGVALGGSAILIASYLRPDAAFHGYDVFATIPPPGADDDARSHARFAEISAGRAQGIGGDVYYGYIHDLYERVCKTFAEFDARVDGARIHLHRGRFEETIDPSAATPVAFAHIDCDWHLPVRHCLTAIARRMQPGGRIVFDDYMDYGGCRKAVDQFLEQTTEFRLLRHRPNAALERL